MKAIVVHEFGKIGTAKLEEVPDPVPAAGEVVVDVALAPANFVDTLVLQGTYQFLPPLPFTPGKGPVGTVVQIGEGVGGLVPGDRVLAMAESGGYAERVAVAADHCYRLPDTMSFEDASCISLAYDTAWFALTDRARLEEGQSVLVLGSTGAVGKAAIQLAKAMGAFVIAGVSSTSRAGEARAAGADAVIDLSEGELRNTLRERVRALTAGKGADIVIDPLGGDYFEAAIRAVAWRGRLVVIGFAAGRIPEVRANYLLLKNIEVTGLQVSDYRKRMPMAVRQCFERVFALYERGQIRPGEVQVFPLEDYAEALSALLERRLTGRAVLRP